MTSRAATTPATPPRARRTMTAVAAGAVMAMACWSAGCSSPPSVTPLLGVVSRALQAEKDSLQADASRLDAQYAGQRQSLQAGFEADLAGRTPLEPTWVAEHVRVYVAAREALAEAHVSHRRAIEQRRANLRDALAAQQRAMALIEQQDKLLDRVPDLRRWLDASTNSTSFSSTSTESDR